MMTDIKNEIVIDHVTVFVTVDKDGMEGVMGELLNGIWMPFVFAHDRMIEKVLPTALRLKQQHEIDFKILRFSTREDVTEKFK